MSLSDNNRRKGAMAAAGLLGPHVHVLDYAVGATGSWPTGVALAIAAAWVLLMAAIYAVLHTFVALGVLPLLVIRFALTRPRGFVIAPQGLAVLNRSFWNGKPDGINVLLPAGVLSVTRTKGNWVEVVGGPEALWVTKRELPRLAPMLAGGSAPGVTTSPVAMAAPSPGFAPPPVPPPGAGNAF